MNPKNQESRIKNRGRIFLTIAILGILGSADAKDASEPAKRFDPSGLGLLRTIAPGGDPFGIAFTNDGRRLAVGVEHAVAIYETEQWREIARLTGSPQVILGLAWSPDGKAIAAGGFEGGVAIWDVRTGALVHTLAGHTSYVGALAFSPDGRTLVTGSHDGSTRAWDPESGQERRGPGQMPGAAYSVVFSRDGRRLALGLGNGEAKLLRAGPAGWEEERTFGSKGNGNVISVLFTRDGTGVAAATETALFLCRMAPGAEERRFEIASSGALGSVRLSPDDRYAIACGSDMIVRLYDLQAKGKEVARLQHHTGALSGLAVHPSGRTIATIGNDHHLKIWGRVAGGMARIRPKGFCGIRVQLDGAGRIAVSEVIPGTAAEAAGLRPGDVLKSVGGTEIHNTTEAIDKIGSYLEGDEVDFTIDRAGEAKTLRIRLGKRLPDLPN